VNFIGILEIEGHDVFRIWKSLKESSTSYKVFFDKSNLADPSGLLTSYGTQLYKQLLDVNPSFLLLCDEEPV